MKFSDVWGVAGDAPKSDGHLPHVPDGTHQATVKYVDKRADQKKKSDANPGGDYLLVLLEVSGYASFFSDIPIHMRGLLESVCRAASIHPPGPEDEWESWDVKQFKGKVVTVTTVHGISKAGRDYVRVEKWSAGPKPLPKAIAAAPRREAAATPAVGDDIPF